MPDIPHEVKNSKPSFIPPTYGLILIVSSLALLISLVSIAQKIGLLLKICLVRRLGYSSFFSGCDTLFLEFNFTRNSFPVLNRGMNFSSTSTAAPVLGLRPTLDFLC